MTANVYLVICYYKMTLIEDLEFCEFVNNSKPFGKLSYYCILTYIY